MKQKKTIVALGLLMLTSFNSNAQQTKAGKSSDLSYYQWYGKRFDWMLDLWGGHPSHRDSIPLFIREVGSGTDTFLVLHGGWGAEHSYLLDALLPLANKAHFIFYDQRGSLRSACADSVLSTSDHLNDIDRIRKSFNMERINLIGHSMGTWLAMAYLDKYPDHAGKLILISGLNIRTATPEERSEKAAYEKNHWDNIFKQQAAVQPSMKQQFGLPDTLSRSVWEQMSQSKKFYINQFWAASGKITDYTNWEKDPTGSNFLYKSRIADIISQTMPRGWNFTESIRRHSFPVIFIKADGDYLSPALLKKNIDGMPHTKLILIEHAGHNMWLEQPKKFRNELAKAMKD